MPTLEIPSGPFGISDLVVERLNQLLEKLAELDLKGKFPIPTKRLGRSSSSLSIGD